MKNLINNEIYYVMDIETSKASVKTEDGYMPVLTWLAYGYITKYNKHGDKLDKFYYRDWETFKKYLSAIENRSFKTLIFVHNLSFEGDFLIKNVSPAKDFCCNSTHNFVSLVLKDYTNIEFRCSYMLSGMKLRELGDVIGLPKLEDDYFNYKPNDIIPESSKQYCERDCDIVGLYVSKLIKEYGRLENVPYTKTGRVRKTLQSFYGMNENRDTTWDLLPDEDVYDLENDSFSGGISTSNPKYTGIIIENVHSYDITSSYPFVMLSEKFPRIMKRLDLHTISELRKHKHFIARMKIRGIESKYHWGWLSTSKCRIDDTIRAEIWNGKIISVDNNYEIEVCLNDVDVENLLMTYEIEHYEILESCVSDEDEKLPQCYINTIKRYAAAKYEAKKNYKKNPTNENYEIMVRAKGDFNSIYGMCVQKICGEDFKIDEYGVWNKVDKPYKKTKRHIKRNFLFGTYITAYARRNLLKAICTNCAMNFLYCDTDSIKFFGKNDFEDTNCVLEEYKNDVSLYGLGRFDYEGTYDIFKTYGAKKYMYKVNNTITTVVAGLPKDVKCDVEDFMLGTLWKDCKLSHVYIGDNLKNVCVCTETGENGTIINYNYEKVEDYKKKNNIKTKGGIALYRVSYLLDMYERDKDFLKDKYDRIVK